MNQRLPSIETSNRPFPRPLDSGVVPRRLLSWPLTALAVPILARAVIFGLALLIEPWAASPVRLIPAWAQNLQALCFASVAFVLLYYGRSDWRAWALGLFIMDAAATLMSPFVRAIQPRPALVWLGTHLHTDAFQAALVWFFASVFPAPSQRPRLSTIFSAATMSAFALGVALVGLDALAHLTSSSPQSALTQVARVFQQEPPHPGDWFHTVQFLALAPLLVLMPLKLRESGDDDRRRFMWLAIGLAVGYFPLVVNTLLFTVSPWYVANALAPPVGGAIGGVIVVCLTAVPVAAAYAALVQRTLDVRLVLRKAMRYLLARSFIATLAAAPFVALLAVIASNRERTVVELVSGPIGITLASLTIAGVAAAIGRRGLTALLDRRFFRQQVDARAMLLGVASAVHQATSLEDLGSNLCRAAEYAFHPQAFATVVAGSDDNLHAIDADLPPLARSSALAQLVGGKGAPFEISPANALIVDRLSPGERAWLKASHAALLVPLRSTGDELIGLLVLGEKKSEMPYTREDQSLLAAAGASGGLALDRILAAARDDSGGNTPSRIDPPGRECIDCGTVLKADAVQCICGGLLERAAAPYTLGDRLRFIQRIGSGGMGVVYRALDLRLQQVRAVKTLPRTDAALTSRMRREARSMAAARHVNLATLHGLEVWRGSPMLVMEFLEAGTLSDRIRRDALAPDDALALGFSLANGLGALHGSHLLHRDIKPSNIGFTAEGVPKLLDFGLAMLVPTVPTTSRLAADPEATRPGSLSTDGLGIRGTPAYLSPEVLGGAPPSVDDDLWSLSVTLLEACTGTNPFRASTIAATVARVLHEQHLAADAARALSDPIRRLFADLLGPLDGRPRTARELAHHLHHLT